MASIAAVEDDGPRRLERAWTLPIVTARRWPMVRAVLVALLALAIGLEVLGIKANYERALTRPFAHIGLSGWKTVNGAVTLRAPHTAEAVAAGLREDQTLVAVDGVRVGNRVADMVAVDRLLTRPEGTAITLTTRDPAGVVRTHRVTRSAAHADALWAGSGMNGATGIAIMLACQALPDFFLLFVAAMLMRSRRRETVGLLFSLAFAGLVMTGPATFGLFSSDWQLLFARAVSTVAQTALTIALLSFPDGRIIGRGRKAVTVIAVALCVVSAFINDWTDGNLSFILLTATIALPTLALVLRVRHADFGAERQQIKYALFGFATGAVLMASALALGISVPEQTVDNTAVTSWMYLGAMICGALALIAMAGGLLLSLVRYRLYDVDAVISRSAAYGLMTIGFVAAFAALENMLEQAAQTYFSGNAGTAAGAMSAALAAGLIGPMHNRFHAWSEKRFRKGLVAMRRDLPNAIDDLRETATFDELAAAVEPAVARGVSAQWVRLRSPGLLGAGDIDQRGEFEQPVVAQDGRLLSLLEVGPRPDGSAHGKDEREAIAGLAEPLARALSVIERREAKERAIDRRIGALEAAVRRLSGKKAAGAT